MKLFVTNSAEITSPKIIRARHFNLIISGCHYSPSTFHITIQEEFWRNSGKDQLKKSSLARWLNHAGVHLFCLKF